jgi:hypothetical protein
MSIETDVKSVELKAITEGTALLQSATTAGTKLWSYLQTSSLVVIALVVLLAGGFFLHAKLQSYDAALLTAKTYDEAYKKTVQAYEDQLKSDQAKIASIKTQTTVIEKTIAANDQSTKERIIYVTKSDDTIQQVQSLATQYLPETPTVTPDAKLAFKPATVQTFIATKIQLDSTTKDLDSKGKELDLANQRSTTDERDLAAANATNDAAKKDIEGYKVAAKGTKWSKIKGVLVTGAIAAGAYELGHLASK